MLNVCLSVCLSVRMPVYMKVRTIQLQKLRAPFDETFLVNKLRAKDEMVRLLRMPYTEKGSRWWRSGVVVIALDSRSTASRFDCRLTRFRVQLWASCSQSHTRASVTKQYNLVPA